MTYGFMPGHEKTDRETSIPKGQSIAGFAIGILTAEFWYPYEPGYVGNATTFNFPVLYKIIEGATTSKIVEGNPALLNAIIEGGRELERQGVRAITGACGYFANYQNEVAAKLNVPVFLSPLLQVPIVRRSLKPNQKIGIVCAVAESATPEMLSQCGIDDPGDVVIVGCLSSPEFQKLNQDTGSCNSYRLEQQLVDIAKELVNNNRDIGALVLECADLPAYAWAIHNAVRLPVFDFTTLINWVYGAVVRRPFAGFI